MGPPLKGLTTPGKSKVQWPTPAPPKCWMVTVKARPPCATKPPWVPTSDPLVTNKVRDPSAFDDHLVVSPKTLPGYPGRSPMWSTQSKCPLAEPSENSVASNPKELTPLKPAATRSVMLAVPPPWMVHITDGALTAAEAECAASIATAREIAGMRYASLFMMSPIHVPQ